MKTYRVYMAANKSNKVLYTGMTSDLETRIAQHKAKTFEGFSARYNVNKLVYFEETSDVHAAILREKQIKGWKREKKNALVAGLNPEWCDLSMDWHSPCHPERSEGSQTVQQEEPAEILRCAQDDKR